MWINGVYWAHNMNDIKHGYRALICKTLIAHLRILRRNLLCVHLAPLKVLFSDGSCHIYNWKFIRYIRACKWFFIMYIGLAMCVMAFFWSDSVIIDRIVTWDQFIYLYLYLALNNRVTFVVFYPFNSNALLFLATFSWFMVPQNYHHRNVQQCDIVLSPFHKITKIPGAAAQCTYLFRHAILIIASSKITLNWIPLSPPN